MSVPFYTSVGLFHDVINWTGSASVRGRDLPADFRTIDKLRDWLRFGGSDAEGRFSEEQMVAIIREADRDPVADYAWQRISDRLKPRGLRTSQSLGGARAVPGSLLEHEPQVVFGRDREIVVV